MDPLYTGSELRDRLANERTLLAWIRTALALMAFGVALAKFALVLRLAAVDHAISVPSPVFSKSVGASLIGLGGAVALMGAWRTRTYARLATPSDKPPSATALWLTAGGTVFLAVALIGYVLFT
ncbi:MAG: DUF202 domain-containing protein [Myxococcales bacterium]|nr:DUF202 domain-containing protein [Myxococcales bacterium]